MQDRDDLNIKSQNIGGSQLVVENLWVEIEQPNKKDNLILGVIYKHPGCSKECNDSFTEQICHVLDRINNENKNCIITGDLNIDGLKINTNCVKNFFDTILQHYFVPTITLPTRITDHSVSLIDHILINSNLVKQNNDILTGNIYCGITDHLPNFIYIKSKLKLEQKRPMVRIYGKKNTLAYRDKIIHSPWKDFFKSQNADFALDTLYQNLNKAYYSSFPLKKLSKNRAKDKEWFTAYIKKNVVIKKN